MPLMPRLFATPPSIRLMPLQLSPLRRRRFAISGYALIWRTAATAIIFRFHFDAMPLFSPFTRC